MYLTNSVENLRISRDSVDLLQQTGQIEQEYERNVTSIERKQKGQFFTPPEVCRFMADLLLRQFPNTFRFLDPGAGVGALSAAVCERTCGLESPRHLEIHLFENDLNVLPFLRRTMELCRSALELHGHSLAYEIHHVDFILDSAASFFGNPSLFRDTAKHFGNFDAAILNPPYFKVNKESAYARVMQEVVHGQQTFTLSSWPQRQRC